MSSMCEGSITGWIGDMRSGGDAAAQQLWERYFDSLVRLACKKLRTRVGGGGGRGGRGAERLRQLLPWRLRTAGIPTC